jgi:hypothetical protein
VAGLRGDAGGVHAAGVAFLSLGAVLYWAAGVLYAVEIRRRASSTSKP